MHYFFVADNDRKDVSELSILFIFRYRMKRLFFAWSQVGLSIYFVSGNLEMRLLSAFILLLLLSTTSSKEHKDDCSSINKKDGSKDSDGWTHIEKLNGLR